MGPSKCCVAGLVGVLLRVSQIDEAAGADGAIGHVKSRLEANWRRCEPRPSAYWRVLAHVPDMSITVLSASRNGEKT